MYRILLVDDEMPALRFLQAIIGKYAPDFSVCASYTNGAAALEYLGKYPVDLLITDISMDGMNGIELAQAAREARPDIHILILSGYSEFEYAQGAIRAAVDDYILKPVPIPQITKALKTIREKLDEEAGAKGPALLSALFSGAPFDENLLERLYGGAKYHFALVRWGNLRLLQPPLTGSAPVPLAGAPFSALYGRDDDEQILFMSARTAAGEFQQAVKAYVAQRKPTAWTILFSRRPEPFREIAGFFGRAARQMEKTVVVGRRQFAFLGQGDRQECPRIPAATLKKLDLFMQGGDLKMVKVNFLSLAVDWEKRQVPQLYVHTMVQQIVNLALASRPTLATRQDAVFRDVDELMKYASSYGELMAGLYTVLFDENAPHDKKMTAEDLYACAVRYVREKYAQPISIQHVCAEVGISQTYLSRLFRKFGSTSFNSFLTRCRMESAMSMIRENADLPLRSIAACVGYDDYAYFSKVFHQYVGCTPSQFASSLKTAPAQPRPPAAAKTPPPGRSPITRAKIPHPPTLPPASPETRLPAKASHIGARTAIKAGHRQRPRKIFIAMPKTNPVPEKRARAGKGAGFLHTVMSCRPHISSGRARKASAASQTCAVLLPTKIPRATPWDAPVLPQRLPSQDDRLISKAANASVPKKLLRHARNHPCPRKAH